MTKPIDRWEFGILIAFAILMLSVLVLVYFPFLWKARQIWCDTEIKTMADVQAYASAISSASTVLASVIGLILGYLYFVGRKRFDISIHEQVRNREHAKLMLVSLQEYDALINQLLSKQVADDSQLNVLRGRFQKHWDMFIALLDSPLSDSLFSKEENRSLVSIHSFVDKQRVISMCTYKELKATDVSQVQDLFNSYFRTARAICVSKIS